MTSYANTRSVLSGDPSVNLTVAQPHYHQLKRAIAHMSRWLVGAALVPVLATASPLLTLSVNSIAIIGQGDASMASGITKSWVTWDYFKGINPAAQKEVASGTLFQGNGPAQRVLVEQLYNPGLFASAASTLGSDSEYIQEVISGTWTLSETAMVRRDIYLFRGHSNLRGRLR